MKLVYRLAGGISVLSTGFYEKLVERGVPRAKVRTIYNWAPEAGPREPGQKSAYHQQLRLLAVIDEVLGKAQALHHVLDAAAQLATTAPEIQFVFIGDGIEAAALKERAQVLQLANVLFLPRMSFDEIPEALAAADALLVHLPDDPLFEITIPSKTQAYLAAGRPIVMAVSGEAAELVDRAGAGIRCRPGDPESIARASLAIYRLPKDERTELGRRGRAFYEQNLSLKAAINQLETYLCDVAGTRPPRRLPRFPRRLYRGERRRRTGNW